MTPSKDETANSLDQIRNILIGEKDRQDKKNFKDLHARLAKESQSMRAELSRSIDEVEAVAEKERVALRKELEQEVAARVEGQTSSARRLSDAAKRFDEKLAKLAEKQKAALDKLNDKLQAELAAQHEEFSARYEEIEAAVEELQATTVGKEDLSSFFANIALELVDKKQIRRS